MTGAWFVHRTLRGGFSGEQYALPLAVEQLAQVRKARA